MTDLDDLFRRSDGLSSREPEADGLERRIDWWRGELGDAPPLHEMPTDHERSARRSSRTERRPIEWSARLVRRLRETAGGEVSTSELLLAGYAALVRRYTGQRTAVVGILSGGDLLPLGLEFGESTSFRELTARVGERARAGLEHYVPFDRLVEGLDVDRSEAYQPVVQLAFGWGTSSDGEREGDPDARFDLSLRLEASNGGLRGALAYDPDLFDGETIDRLTSHLRHLLEQAAEDPDRSVDALALPTDEERRVLLEEWNDTDIDVDLDRCFHELFEERAERTPEAVAVVEPGGGELTYAELDRRSNRLAHHLLAKGVEPEDLIAICTERSLELVVGILGILKAGAAYLPLNPTYPADRIEFILEETDPPVAVTQASADAIFSEADAELVRLDSDASEIADRPETSPNSGVEPHHLAYVVYTSGSTGRPKGVMNEHRNVVNLAATLGPAFGVEADDRVSQFVSETFDATIWEFAMCFPVGATLVLLPSGRPPLGLELGRYLRDERVTLACLPPAVVPDIPEEMASGVETMVVAGEACPAKVVENWAPGRRFINGYGPRETTAYATCADCEPGDDPPPIGRPLGNYKAYVLDEHRQLLPVGVEGELYIGGPGVGRGYLERPELNAEKFLDDPFAETDEARMYRTGDVVRWRADGQLEFVGRTDFQVQLRGFRVELGAIEEELRDHQAVRDAVATKHEPDDNPPQLVAYVVAEPGEDEGTLPGRLREHLEETLPEYMVPARIVVLDEFPLNTTGKVDRGALPAPALGRRTNSDDRTGPRTELEEKVAGAWREVLPVDEVGVHEDFFELGGTSLMIARLALGIKDRFDVELPVRALYETPTVTAMAERVDASEGAEEAAPNLCFDPSLDLEEESRLSPDVDPADSRVDPAAEPERMLLTGATGFVGTHLLEELLERTAAEIHCLVRGRDRNHLRERLREAFEHYEIDRELSFDRVHPVVGDLAAESLGLDDSTYSRLAASVDAVYHNGAMVDQVRSYQAMKGPNVTGTERMLRFACAERAKPFHYVSTTGSVHYPEYADDGVVSEEAPAGPLEKLPNGYMQTKCVGEQMVQTAIDRGLPASIYRLGAVSGHTQTGACEPADFTYSILRTAVDLGLAPALNPDLMITPVDFVARSIAELSRWPDGLGEVFHVTHPDGTPLQEAVDLLETRGHTIHTAPFDRFLERLSEETRRGGETPLLRFVPYLSQRIPGRDRYKAEEYYVPVTWECRNLTSGLAEREAPRRPPPADELIPLYVDQLAQRGYL